MSANDVLGVGVMPSVSLSKPTGELSLFFRSHLLLKSFE